MLVLVFFFYFLLLMLNNTMHNKTYFPFSFLRAQSQSQPTSEIRFGASKERLDLAFFKIRVWRLNVKRLCASWLLQLTPYMIFSFSESSVVYIHTEYIANLAQRKSEQRLDFPGSQEDSTLRSDS